MVTSSRIPSLRDTSGGVPDIPIHCVVSSHILSVQFNSQQSPSIPPDSYKCALQSHSHASRRYTLVLPERHIAHLCEHVSLHAAGAVRHVY